MKIKVSNVNTPNWKEVTVKSRIPEITYTGRVGEVV